MIPVKLRPAQEYEDFFAAVLVKIIPDPRGREFFGRLFGNFRRRAAQRENMRASLARCSQKSVAALFLAGRRIEMQARHGAAARGGSMRPFVENNLLLAGDCVPTQGKGTATPVQRLE